jgi:hypothetical protein
MLEDDAVIANEDFEASRAKNTDGLLKYAMI